MRTYLTAVLASLALVSSAAAEPTPDPPPGGHWDGTYFTYTYDTVSRDGFFRFRCVVPADGSVRTCRYLGLTRNGVRAALR
jgi:hypothetical protein